MIVCLYLNIFIHESISAVYHLLTSPGFDSAAGAFEEKKKKNLFN